MKKMNIKLKIKFAYMEVDIEIEDFDDDFFDILDKIVEFYKKNSNLLVDEVKISNTKKPERKQEITEPIETEEKEISKYYEIIKDADIQEADLIKIYDIERLDIEQDLEIPPINKGLITGKSNVEQQRKAIILLLYWDYLINQNKQLSSYTLTSLIEKSGVTPKNLFNAFAAEKYKNLIEINGKNYRLLLDGREQARKWIKLIIENGSI